MKECADHELWHKHLTIAFWLSIIVSWMFTLSGGELSQSIVLLAVGIALYGARLRSDRKHYEWHLGQEREE